MKSRFLADYGMIFVLLLLCAYFSVVTYKEQFPIGEAAAKQVAASIRGQSGKAPRVLVVAGMQPGDAEFAAKLGRDLAASGAQVLAVVKGEPSDAGEALQKIAASGSPLDAIACTQVAGTWLVFSDLRTRFPTLGKPRLITPRSYYWPDFLKQENLHNIANQIAIIAIMAIGMTMVIVTGGVDLSVGSLLALSAVLATRFIRDFAGGVQAAASGMVVACLAAIVLCGVVGGCTGSLIAWFRLPPFIVTLAIMFAGSGLAFKLASNETIYQLPDSFVWLDRGSVVPGLRNPVVIMLILYVLAHVMMSRMKLGRYLYAVGGNSEAARLSGISVQWVLVFAYVVSAMFAGLGGVLMASQLKSGAGVFGVTYELYVITGVIVGGTSLSGGEGKIFGTLIGAFIIAVIQNGMNLRGTEPNDQKIVLGLVLLGAVLIDRLRRRDNLRPA